MLYFRLAVVFLAGLCAAQTVNDCPAAIPRNKFLKVFSGACYEFITDNDYYYLSYSDANSDCKSRGGSLVLVKTKDVSDFLVDQLVFELGNANRIWIGLSDKTVEGTYVWEDGTSLGDYKNWAVGATADNNTNHDCATLDPSKSGQWQLDFCADALFGLITHDRPYVCQYRTRTPVGVATTAKTGAAQTVNDCPAGIPRNKFLKVFNGACYEFITDDDYYYLSYSDANSDCKSRGGSLVLVKTKDVSDFLVDQLVFELGNANRIWIGLSDKTVEGTYVWEDGTSLGDYKNWAVGATADNNTNHDCATLDPSKSGQWQLDFCADALFGLITHDRPYVCQYRTRTPVGVATTAKTG